MIDTRALATELIRSAAGDIDLMGIGEFLEGRSIDDPDGTVAQEIDGLIRKATVVLPAEPAEGLDLDAIEARANAATPGPWEAYDDGLVWTKTPRIGDPVSGSVEPEDAEFIAAARTDVPALAAEVRRLRKVLDEITRMCECRNGDICPSAIAHYALHGPDADADA